jgi:hypothetical protein
MVKQVEADAQRFSGLLAQYNANPALFIQQHQVEVLQRVLTNAQDRILLPRRNDGRPREVRLQINPDARAPKPVEMPAAEDKH